MSGTTTCAWCENEVAAATGDEHPWFCTDCSERFEAENVRPIHPMEERHPHND